MPFLDFFSIGGGGMVSGIKIQINSLAWDTESSRKNIFQDSKYQAKWKYRWEKSKKVIPPPKKRCLLLLPSSFSPSKARNRNAVSVAKGKRREGGGRQRTLSLLLLLLLSPSFGWLDDEGRWSLLSSGEKFNRRLASFLRTILKLKKIYRYTF